MDEEITKIEETKKIFNRLFSTSDGTVFGKWLINECGFLLPSTVSNKNGFDLSGTLYNEARRNLYLEIRSYLDEETLINLEKKETTNGNK